METKLITLMHKAFGTYWTDKMLIGMILALFGFLGGLLVGGQLIHV